MVYFVGAGCGAPDLITVRGANLLRQADVVIYAGSLVSPELLKYCKPSCEIHNSALMTLDEVIAVTKDAHLAQKTTVRLHTGDPSIYGAIKEQMDALTALNIDYEVCPGVSSFCGVAAALKAEYTLPGISQSVIITRMEGRTKVPERESIRSFASHQTTMVIFLSAGLTKTLEAELLAGGFAPTTPVAVVYRASWPDERIVRCSVGTLHDSVTSSGIKNHALIVVGEFLGDDYELSKLYDPHFATAFRPSITPEDKA